MAGHGESPRRHVFEPSSVPIAGRTRRLLALIFGMLAGAAAASPTLAVLDFELVDLAETGDTAVQMARTARLAPLLRQALTDRGLAVVAVPPAAQAEAERSFGYLRDHPDIAAALARRFGADWIVVNGHHRPTPLFSYLRARLIDAHTARAAEDYVVEIKGPFEITAPRGAARLAEDIAATLAAGQSAQSTTKAPR
jgi:hypothetical protein